jgi:hypothetical protein
MKAPCESRPRSGLNLTLCHAVYSRLSFVFTLGGQRVPAPALGRCRRDELIV